MSKRSRLRIARRETVHRITESISYLLLRYRLPIAAAFVYAIYYALALLVVKAVDKNLPTIQATIIIYFLEFFVPVLVLYYVYKKTKNDGIIYAVGIVFIISTLAYGSAYWYDGMSILDSSRKMWADFEIIANEISPGPLGIVGGIFGIVVILGALVGFYVFYYVSIGQFIRFATDVLTFKRNFGLKDIGSIALLYFFTAVWFALTFGIIEYLVGHDIFLVEHKTWKIIDLVYLSVGNITSYSDSAPITWYAKLLSLAEVLIGQFMVVIVIAMCFANVVQRQR